MNPEDYMGMIQDAITMGKNVCVMRHFDNFDIHSTHRPFVDVWPSCVRFNEEFDNTFTLLLQLACVLHMKGGWKTHWKIRIFIITETDSDGSMETLVIQDFLKEARIEAQVRVLPQPVGKLYNTFTDSFTTGARMGRGLDYYSSLNTLMKEYSDKASVIFTALPLVPPEAAAARAYITELSTLSDNLPPLVMVYGSMPVISNSL